MLNNHIHTIITLIASTVLLLATSTVRADVSTYTALDSIPTVFKIGENEIAYEKLVSVCSQPLLSVCQDSMDLAYEKWMLMLSDMEKHAESAEFDIKGIKIWLNVFWNSDGTIKNLIYYPKPNSRNMDFDLLTKFLDSFSGTYSTEIQFSGCYSHYGSAAFPTFSSYYLNGK